VDQYVDNWAKCDTLCNHTLGTFVDYVSAVYRKPGELGQVGEQMAATSFGSDAHPSRQKGPVSEGDF